ncbi:MAG TPA: ComEC/Rec2 family competence protein [Mycobacteriales bacterium]|nr:ComEC/Rec2 family competence protein [Mycobacteriales bacterium]
MSGALPADSPRADALDVRLALPALAAWVTAWQVAALPVLPVLVGAAVTAIAALTVLASGRSALIGAALACAAAAAASTAVRTDALHSGALATYAQRGAAVVATGRVTGDPRLTATQLGPSRRDLIVVRVRIEQLRVAGRHFRIRAPVVVLSGDRAWLPLLPSQRVVVEGRLRAADPGDDVAAVLSGRGPPRVLSSPSAVHAVAGRFRAGLQAAVAPLPAAERGLLPGLVLGDTSRTPAQVREDFRTTGLSHLTAVSGTNVAIVVGAVLLLTAALGLPLRWRPVLAGVALLGFVILVRPSPSVLRAAVMGTVGLIALGRGGRRAAMPALAAAVLILVLVDPALARTPGFALSVLATTGLLVFAPPLRDRLTRWLPRPLAAAVAVPTAAQLMCGPIVVALSGELSLVSVPANLLAIVAVAPATVLGVLAAVIAPVALPLAQVIAWVAWVPTAWLVGIARTGAEIPGSAIAWPTGNLGAGLLVAGSAVAVAGFLWSRLGRVLLAAATGAALTAGTASVVRPSWPPPGWFLVMCDVGQGSAVVLNAGPGAAVVVDAGPNPELVDQCLSRLDVDRVPLLVLTHAHADHVDGLPGVLRGRRVALVQVGPLDEPDYQAREVARLSARAGVPIQRAALGERRTVGPLSWEVLAPTRPYERTRSDPNNSSLVLRVSISSTTILLTGDIEPEAQRDLLARGIDVRADVMTVPHHGSGHQEPAFLDAVGARVALTSVGKDNTYGHPAARTLHRLRAGSTRTYRTDADGDIALAHQGGRLVVVRSA